MVISSPGVLTVRVRVYFPWLYQSRVTPSSGLTCTRVDES